MQRLILSGAALLFTVGATIAADLEMPVYKAPPIVPLPSWTGPFVGATIGAGFGGGPTNDVSGKNLFCAGGVVFCSSPISQQNFSASGGNSGSNTSFAGGVQLGYNYQFNPSFVVGGVVDFTALNRSGGTTVTTPPMSLGANVTETRSYTDSVTNDWLMTVRLKAGPTFDNFWIYGTGGLAIGDLKSSSSSVTTWNAPYYTPPTQIAASGSGSSSGVAYGYVVGGGAEYRFAPNWSVFAEYLYYSLSDSYTVTVTPNTALTGITGSSSYGVNTKINGNLVKVGLNYAFRIN
jgi:outer membrane immunogenic protein